MVVSLDLLDDDVKLKILDRWRWMSESDKAHFINQLALALSVWGSDEKGKRIATEVLRLMMSNGTKTLADFGLYIEKAIGLKEISERKDKVERAALIIEGYRIKNSLSSEPHRELV